MGPGKNRLVAAACAAWVAASPGVVAAQPAAAGGASTARPATGKVEDDDRRARAMVHFERGRELYREGSYKEALVELEAAQRLDPEAKDLVLNLSIVTEKLSRFDESLRWMRRYRAMDLDEGEQTRAEAAIKRLEGARKSLGDKPERPSGPTPATPAAMGRVDALTLAAGGVAVVGLGVGTIFGIDALGSRPKKDDGFVTGRDGTYADLAARTDSAHNKAIVADVGFGVFVAGGVACALLYFLRPKASPAATAKGSSLPFGGVSW